MHIAGNLTSESSNKYVYHGTHYKTNNCDCVCSINNLVIVANRSFDNFRSASFCYKVIAQLNSLYLYRQVGV